jgi:hypothetical protein
MKIPRLAILSAWVVLIGILFSAACTQNNRFPTVPPIPSASIPTQTPNPAPDHFILQWGSLGSAVSQFSTYPTGIAVGSSDVFIVNGGSVTIQVFDLNGNYLNSWSMPQSVTLNSTQYQFQILNYLAFNYSISNQGAIGADSANNLYILGTAYSSGFNAVLLKFNSTGTLLNTVGLFNDSNYYGSLTGLTVDSSGSLFLIGSIQPDTCCPPTTTGPATFVMELSSTFTPVTGWGVAGVGPGLFENPSAIAVDGSDNVYDIDFPYVQRFSSTGTYLNQIGTAGTGTGQWLQPEWITIDGSNNVYLYDSKAIVIDKYSPSGTYLGQFGGYGTGNGQFISPNGIAADSGGDVFVIDQTDYRIEKFHP